MSKVPTIEEVLALTKNLTAMIIEDDSEISVSLSKLVSRFFKTVHSFDNPLDALNFYNQHPHTIDLLITDISMPGMDGIELTREIKKFNPEQKIVIHSAVTNQMSKDVLTEIGINAYIPKPPKANDFLFNFYRLFKDNFND